MILKDASVPVVLIKSHNHGCLGIARSLGRLGISVYGVDPNKSAPGLSSRFFKQKFVFDVDRKSIQETVRYLQEVVNRIGKRCILMPTYDECSVMVADYSHSLSKNYLFHVLSPKLVRALTSKREMHFLAKDSDVPTAAAYFPKSRDDVERYLQHAVFPIMLKGIHGKAAKIRCGSKMFIARTKKELLDLYIQYEDPSNQNFMLQEYIPGNEDSVWMFNGYFNDKSECLFEMTGRKIRQTPPYTGMTSLGICLKNNIVSEMTKRFMEDIGYKGILDIGYRFDKRDGKYKVLDINPRIGCTFRLFVGDNGLDVARVQYLDLTGQQVPSSHIIEGRKWLIEDSDFFSSITYYLDKKLTIKQWAKSLQGVKETAWYASDDLFPFFSMCGSSSLNAIRQASRLVSSRKS